MPELYSHSRLSSYETCPKKFEYRYIQKIRTETQGIEGFVGKRVHEVLEALYKVARNGQVPSLEKVIARFHRIWDSHYDPEHVVIVRDQPAEFYRGWGEQCLGNYYRDHYPFDGDETVALERRVTFALDDSPAYRMQGIIDRISRTRDGTLEIHDYKTSQRVPSQRTLDKDRQLALYQIGVAREFGDDQPISLVWHYVGRGQVRRSTRTPEQLQRLSEDTMALIDRIRDEDDWRPRPGPLCRWCDYGDRCPVGPSRAADPAPATTMTTTTPVPDPTPAPDLPEADPPVAAQARRRPPRRQRPEATAPGAPEQLSLL